MKIDSKNNYHLIDSNILVYATDAESALHEEAKLLFSRCLEGQIKGVLAQQNLLELINVLVKYYKKESSFATKTARVYSDKFALRIISPLPTTFALFDKLSSQSKKLDTYDLYLAATALDNGVDSIITNNSKDFKGIEGLEVYGLGDIKSLVGVIKSEHE